MTDIYNELVNSIKARRAIIGIIGMGYVGLPLVIRFCEEGFRVIGFDIDPKKIIQLNAGKSYIKHIDAKNISKFIKSKNFEATTDFSRLKIVDCIIICVPTPLTVKKEPDLTYIDNTSEVIGKNLRKGHFISLESTTYPGTTRERLLSKFEIKNLKVGRDYFLAFSPEREDPGNLVYSTKHIPKVVGGITAKCLKIGRLLYGSIIDKIVPVSSTEAAELTKLLENIYRSINIALVNELKILCHKMNIDIWEVIKASSTKPFGFTPFYPGPGLGGHCIPIDPFYLSWKAKEYNIPTRFIELAGEVNTYMPEYVVSRLADALNNAQKSIKGSNILLLGMAYKSDVDDHRESPALEIMHILGNKGAKIKYNDPYIPQIKNIRKYNYDIKSVKLTKKLLRDMDAVIIVTNHRDYDYKWIVENSKLVVDSRGATKGLSIKKGRVLDA